MIKVIPIKIFEIKKLVRLFINKIEIWLTRTHEDLTLNLLRVLKTQTIINFKI